MGTLMTTVVSIIFFAAMAGVLLVDDAPVNRLFRFVAGVAAIIMTILLIIPNV